MREEDWVPGGCLYRSIQEVPRSLGRFILASYILDTRESQTSPEETKQVHRDESILCFPRRCQKGLQSPLSCLSVTMKALPLPEFYISSGPADMSNLGVFVPGIIASH